MGTTAAACELARATIAGLGFGVEVIEVIPSRFDKKTEGAVVGTVGAFGVVFNGKEVDA